MLGAGPVIGVSIDKSYSLYSTKTDFSINAMAGYEIEIGFSLNVNYTYGLTNLNIEDQTGLKYSNRYVGITVGYSF